MKAAVLHKERDLRIQDVPEPKMGPDDVRVKVKSVGVCGSDVHYWRTGHIGDFIVKEPMILGHEASGVVEKVGANVTNLQEGDRVALEPGIPCRRCEWCKTGRYNLCPDVQFMATPPVDGALSEYVVTPADFAYELPSHVSHEAAALVEPLSVGIHACRRAGLELGQSVFIAGAGPIGIASLMAAKSFGASEIFISDVQPFRLDIAARLGATRTIRAREQDAKEVIDDATNGRGVDVAIECAGAQGALIDCLRTARRGGQIVVVGLGEQSTYELPMIDLAVKELDIKGIFRYVYTYPAALNAIASGQIDVEQMITHHFPFDDLLTGFEYAEHATDGAMKVMIDL